MEKTNPGCLGDLLGMNSFSLYVGIKIRHDIWIPMKQPGFNGKQGRFFFSVGSPERKLLPVVKQSNPG